MDVFSIVAIIVSIGIALFFLITYICFYLTFRVPKDRSSEPPPMSIPEGKVYEPHRELMLGWMKEVHTIPHTDVSATSFDGLQLYGKYYEYEKGAPIELMFHGYRGTAERDLCGGVQRCFALGHSALIVDQRAVGKSEGSVITFGVNESRDCLTWVDYIIEHIHPDVKILLTGISMGASTVLMASGRELPDNVVGVLADCGYTSAKEIIKKVIRQMKLPTVLFYPFVKWGAKLYGKFDVEEFPPIEAVMFSRIPTLFIHGTTDDFVPHEMSVQNYDACAAEKRLLSIPNAGHGLCYIIDKEAYMQALADFFDPYTR